MQAMITCKTLRKGWVSLNTDGAHKGDNQAGCNGLLIRDQDISICGFPKNLETSNVNIVELLAVFERLHLVNSWIFKI